SPAAMPDCSQQLHCQALFEEHPCTAQLRLGPGLSQEKRFRDWHGHLRYPGVIRGLFDNERSHRPSDPLEIRLSRDCIEPPVDLAIARDRQSNTLWHHLAHL